MKKDLAFYLNLEYPVTLTKEIDDEGKTYFVAEIPDLPGCGAHGKTLEEAYNNIEKARKLWIEVSLKKGHSIPEPASEDEFSGKFLLRIPPKLHMELTLEAKKENLSLNQYIKKNLEQSNIVGLLEKKIEEMSEKLDELSRKISKPIETNVLLVNEASMLNAAGNTFWTIPQKPIQKSEISNSYLLKEA